MLKTKKSDTVPHSYLYGDVHISLTREDEWGGSYENRMRFPVSIVKGIRQACGEDFIIIYRLSMLDLIEQGSSW